MGILGQRAHFSIEMRTDSGDNRKKWVCKAGRVVTIPATDAEFAFKVHRQSHY